VAKKRQKRAPGKGKGKRNKGSQRRSPATTESSGLSAKLLLGLGGLLIAALVIAGALLRPQGPPAPPEVSAETQAALRELDLQYREGKFEEGIASAREHLASSASSPGVNYMLGLFLSASGDDAAAAESFAAELELSEGHVDSYLRLAGTLSRLGRSEESRQQLERALEVAPGHAQVSLALGRTLSNEGDLEQAERHLEAALSTEPAAAAFELGLVARKSNDLTAAESWFRRSLEEDPGHLGAVFNLGQTLVLAGRQSEGERFLKRHAELQRHQDRLQVLTRAASQEWSTPGDLVNLGRYQLVQGDAEAAARSFEEALRRDPAHTDALLELARSELERGLAPAAVDHLDRLLELDPGNADASFLLGLSYHVLERYDEARATLARSREAAAWGAEQYLFLANIFFQQGALPDAELAYLEAEKLDDELPDIHYKLALLSYIRGNVAASQAHLERFHSLDPSNPLAWILDGLVAYRLGNAGQAEERFSRGLAQLSVSVTREAEIDQALEGFSSLPESSEALALLRRLRQQQVAALPPPS
jgi:tetratricopeptide (TPR) repeat protein